MRVSFGALKVFDTASPLEVRDDARRPPSVTEIEVDDSLEVFTMKLGMMLRTVEDGQIRDTLW